MNISKIIKTQIKKLSKSLKQIKRVIKVATKPEKDEFLAVAKITLIGMSIIGAIAYVIRSIDVIL
ncbi:MAG: protein translocase SEC61 complex subunit gamma [archaeon]